MENPARQDRQESQRPEEIERLPEDSLAAESHM